MERDSISAPRTKHEEGLDVSYVTTSSDRGVLAPGRKALERTRPGTLNAQYTVGRRACAIDRFPRHARVSKSGQGRSGEGVTLEHERKLAHLPQRLENLAYPWTSNRYVTRLVRRRVDSRLYAGRQPAQRTILGPKASQIRRLPRRELSWARGTWVRHTKRTSAKHKQTRTILRHEGRNQADLFSPRREVDGSERDMKKKIGILSL
jgi:hypothetical protein